MPINGKPTDTTLQQLQLQLFTNACSVASCTSTCGSGLYGHLAMFLNDADYVARAGIAFMVPVHPGLTPPPPPFAGTAAVIAVDLRN